MSDQLVVSIPLTSPATQSVDAMVGEVASLVGGDNDPIVREKVIRQLDRAADRLNLAGLYLYRRLENTWAVGGATDSVDLDTGDVALTMPADWGWPEHGAVAISSDGNRLNEIEWVPWETFTVVRASGSPTNGVPTHISIRNEMEGLIYVWPPADTGSVNSIRIPYFARILRPSEVGDSNLYASKETMEALTTMAEALIMRFTYKAQPQIWTPYLADATRIMEQARAAAARSQRVFTIWAVPAEVGWDSHLQYRTLTIRL